jgi:uncharacterized repeat protein (TIGR01451 family)
VWGRILEHYKNLNIKNSQWSTTMKDNPVPDFNFRKHRTLKRFSASTTALILFAAQVTPALATIDNTATVNGTYSGNPVTATSLPVNVPVVTPAPALTVTKSAALPTIANGTDPLISDGNGATPDTITYTYTVKNTGNVTLTAVAPTDVGPTFNGTAGTGTMGAFAPAPVTLAPNATQVFTATYSMSVIDVYRGAGIASGVANTASATGKTPGNVTVTPITPATATTTIAAGPKIAILKTKVLDDTNGTVAGKAEVGEFIDYTYAVTNTGNVAITGISITDLHEGSNLAAGTVKNETLTTAGPMPGSVDTTSPLNNGVWTTIQAGATVTFTYHHLVTQAEVDGG